MQFRNYKILFQHYGLKFNFVAKTSKNTLYNHEIIILSISPNNFNKSKFIHEPFHQSHFYPHGEISPIKHLSRDYHQSSEYCSTKIDNINKVFENLKEANVPKNTQSCFALARDLANPNMMPSLCFALETLLLDFYNTLKKKKKCVFNSNFYKGEPTKINGLVWINDIDTMHTKISNLVERGFNCIKIKIGQHNIDKEIKLIDKIRKKYNHRILELRLDANGAFDYETASNVLKKLSPYHIHSIEQPIPHGNIELLSKLVGESSIPIALDEELIFASTLKDKIHVVEYVKPKFVVLKPQLLGGFYNTKKIIEKANQLNINWWITSALESNIGLNAIAQFQSYINGIFPSNLAQGLGTGTIYSNNFISPLKLKNQYLCFLQD